MGSVLVSRVLRLASFCIAATVLAVSAVAGARAQEALDDAAIEEAIRTGLNSRRVVDVGLHKLGRRTEVWFGGPIRMGIAVYTPSAWIQLQAAKAKTVYRTFTADDVTAEMKQPVLRVFLKPAIAANLILRNTDKAMVIQPSNAAHCQEVMQFEDQLVGQDYCQEFSFSLDDLAKVQNDKGEFLVTVIGPGRNVLTGNTESYEWDFRIGERDVRRLP